MARASRPPPGSSCPPDKPPPPRPANSKSLPSPAEALLPKRHGFVGNSPVTEDIHKPHRRVNDQSLRQHSSRARGRKYTMPARKWVGLPGDGWVGWPLVFGCMFGWDRNHDGWLGGGRGVLERTKDTLQGHPICALSHHTLIVTCALASAHPRIYEDLACSGAIGAGGALGVSRARCRGCRSRRTVGPRRARRRRRARGAVVAGERLRRRRAGAVKRTPTSVLPGLEAR